MTRWSDAELEAMVDQSSATRRVSPALLRVMTDGWSVPASDVVEWAGAAPRRSRRQHIAQDFAGDTLVVPTGRQLVRSNDVYFPFRPGSDHTWLVGVTEPGSVLVLGPDCEETLYVAQRPPLGHPMALLDSAQGAIWDGNPEPIESTARRLGVETRPLEQLEKRLRGVRARTVRGLDPWVDDLVAADDRELEKQLARRRLIKDAYEIGQLRQAAEAAVEGFGMVAAALPDVVRHGEAFVEGLFTKHARARGRGLAYTPVVGGGHRATVLHWMRNDGDIESGDLLLLDAGVEGAELYASDVTRTRPVSGRYSAEQRDVYDVVHAAHQAAVAAAVPGVPFLDPHHAAQRVLLEGLHGLGVLPHPAFDAVDLEERGRRWTLHGTSHMLGVDVHDNAPVAAEYLAGVLEPGHVLTIEPGLYFSPHDDYAPAALRGIGVRIEDDVVITDDGIEVLTAGLPTSSSDVEDWIASASQF